MTNTTNLENTMHDKIKVEIIESNVLMRLRCHCCGGQTEKYNVVAEVTSGEYRGFRVCEQCLEAGNIDEIMEKHAKALDNQAAVLRAMIGRIEVPTYAEFKAAQDSYDDAYCREVYGMSKDDYEKRAAEREAKQSATPASDPFGDGTPG